MPRSHRFITPARALTCCVALALAWPALALADTARFEIKAEPLSDALKAFAQQAHMQLLYEYDVVRDLQGNPVIGLLEKHAALNELLRNTGLEPVFSSESAATIRVIPARIPDDGTKKSPSTGGNARDSKRKSDSPPSQKAQLGQSDDPDANSSKSATQQSDSTEEFPALQEIIVTAQKYSQRAFDVPISLQVIDGEELQEHGITDLSSLQYDVPGLYMNSTGYTHSAYLRGVGNTNGTDAMVGEYIDDADVTAEGANGAQGYATGDNGLYDLNRVEVLKGPQGTLYGDGSMGGVIRYITNKPALDRFQMSADVAALFTQYGAPSQRIETMLNTPIVAGTFGLRFAGLFEHDGGWIDEPAANQKNINDDNVTDVRAEALWQPTPSFKANMTEIIHRETYGLGMGEDASGNFTPLFGTTLTPTSTNDSSLSNLTLTYDFTSAQLLSSSTYSSGTQNVINLNSVEPAGPATYWLLLPLFADTDANYGEELRLVNSGGGPWHWVVGAFYKEYRFQSREDYYFGLSGSTLSSALYETLPTERNLSNSRAAFTNISYDVLARLTVGGGVRYTQDYERLVAPDFPFSGAHFTSTDPRFYVQYRVTKDVSTYASASKGFRSGGFNTPPLAPYQPENLWSYELGTKLRLPEAGLQAAVAPFLSNYSNFVQTADVAPFYPSSNIGNARISGIDADVMWRLADRWRLSANTEILDTKFLTASAISGYAVGNRLPYAPKYSVTASVQRDFRWRDRPGDAEIYYYQISRVQIRAPGALYQSDIVRFLNARAAINWNENLRLGFFADNLLNDRGFQSPDAFGGNSVRPRPRTFGVEFDINIE